MIERPSFELTDHLGRQVTLETFHGRRCLVFFGFTHCRTVCPRALAKLSDALARAGADGADVQGLYISVDPERDTPERLAEFLRPHPRFLGLTGDAARAAAARDSFGVFVRRRENPEDPSGYDLPHSALTYLLDAEGMYTDHWLDSAPAEEISAGLAGRRSPVARDIGLTARSCCSTHAQQHPSSRGEGSTQLT